MRRPVRLGYPGPHAAIATPLRLTSEGIGDVHDFVSNFNSDDFDSREAVSVDIVYLVDWSWAEWTGTRGSLKITRLEG